jgi:RNA polymerase II-associated protein 1
MMDPQRQKKQKAIPKPMTQSSEGNTHPTEEEQERHGPGWYQQMKGVRFRLDDLEDDDEEPPSQPKPGMRRTEKSASAPAFGSVMGDIVERKTISTTTPVFMAQGKQKSIAGFPAPRKLRRPPQVKSQAIPRPVDAAPKYEQPEEKPLEGKELMEEIDRENRKKLAEMSEEEILELQRSLQASLPAGLQKKLLQKDNAEQQSKSNIPTPSKSRVQTNPVPPKPKSSKPKTSIPDDEKSFDEHLRTFFPPKETSVSQPEWTLPVHPAEETFYSTPDPSVPSASTMRFSLQGKYIPATTSHSLPTHLGLHHHSLDPGAAGYTLSELAILARSVQPSQKCIALKIMGIVLADIARGEYTWDVAEALWDEIEREKVIEILLNVAKGGRESGGNRSVQRYAEDAVTKWVDAGGPKQWEERLQKKGYERIDEDTT